ncbi:MAG: hypothetical protein KGZ66_00630 [Selenomonadales bacterium]|nr:hypothetical protein [Selenomonadales bacterium]
MFNTVVIGATNIDIFGIPFQDVAMRDSNPGIIIEAYGGVGRNIAENLGRLNCHPLLIATVGNDKRVEIERHLREAGVSFKAVITPKTSRYLAVMDENSDMQVSIADMVGLEELTVKDFEPFASDIQHAERLVIDTNFSETLTSEIVKLSRGKIYTDGISTRKVLKLRNVLHRMHVVKLNLLEARALTNIQDGPLDEVITQLRDLPCERIYLTLGVDGVYEITKPLIRHRKFTPLKKAYTTGAGDAFLAGVVHADIHNQDPLLYGQLNARFCLGSLLAVHPDLSIQQLERLRSELHED